MKLKKKQRIGGKKKRQYEKAKTPYQRLLESSQIPTKIKKHLKEVYANLNPAELSRSIDRKLYRLRLVEQAKSWEQNVDSMSRGSSSSEPTYKHIHICPQRKSSKKKFTTTATIL